MVEVVVGPKDGFSEALAQRLGSRFAALERIVFPDGEVKPKVAEPATVAGRDVLLVNRCRAGPEFYPNRHLVEFLLSLRNLRELGAKRVVALMPYLIYARQDKVFLPGEPLSARHVLELLKAAGADALVTVNAHMQKAEGPMQYLPGFEAHSVSAFPAIGEHARGLGLKEPVVVGPDMGVEEGAAEVAAVLGSTEALLKKERDRVTGRIETSGTLDVKGRDVVIVDDIAASGVTLEKAAKLCRQAGAGRVMCAVVHPLLVKDCLQRVRGAGAELVATNTLDSEVSKIDATGAIADYMKKKVI